MTEEEKRHFGNLIEDLYVLVKAIINESSMEDKEDVAKRIIKDFYTKHKEDYNIENIEQVIEGIKTVDENMKKVNNSGINNIKSLEEGLEEKWI